MELMIAILIGVVGGAIGSLIVNIICYRRDMREVR